MPLPLTKRTQQDVFGGLFDACVASTWSPEPENSNFLPSELFSWFRMNRSATIFSPAFYTFVSLTLLKLLFGGRLVHGTHHLGT